MSHFALVKSTSTSQWSHTWIDIVYTNHKKKDIFLRIFHSEKPQLAPSFELNPDLLQMFGLFWWPPSIEQSWHSFLFLARHHKFLNFYLVQFRKKANTIKVRQSLRFCTLMMANWGQCYKAPWIRKNGSAVIFNWPVGVHIKLLKLLYSFVRV